jgi:hypothetical protein
MHTIIQDRTGCTISQEEPFTEAELKAFAKVGWRLK